MKLHKATAQEADDLIEAAQALEAAARKIKDDAKRLRKGELLPTWGYAYARNAIQTAWSAADKVLHD